MGKRVGVTVQAGTPARLREARLTDLTAADRAAAFTVGACA
jgi:hypothetical protein